MDNLPNLHIIGSRKYVSFTKVKWFLYICISKINTMAIAIKSIPVLTDEAAATFVAIADRNFSKKKASVDFSKQVEKANKILAKAKI
jgi:hypothetical protein